MITTLNLLEELRSKEELVNYFREIGENVTDEEIEKLKANYEKIEQNKSHLTMKELDKVAGGGGVIRIHQLDDIVPGQPFGSATLRDATTIQGCEALGCAGQNIKGVFVKFGGNPIIDLSAIGKGRYAIEIATTDATIDYGLYGNYLDTPVDVRLNSGNEAAHLHSRPLVNSVNVSGLISLRDLQSQEPELFSAVFENPDTISFIELQNTSFIDGLTFNVPFMPEPDPRVRTLLENLIRPSNDNSVEAESSCTIM